MTSKTLEIFETEKANIGLAICYEMEFPEVARTLTLKGADVIYHFAAIIGVPHVLGLPYEVLTKNVELLSNIIETISFPPSSSSLSPLAHKFPTFDYNH